MRHPAQRREAAMRGVTNDLTHSSCPHLREVAGGRVHTKHRIGQRQRHEIIVFTTAGLT
jgi:hypothetical protein